MKRTNMGECYQILVKSIFMYNDLKNIFYPQVADSVRCCAYT